MIIYIYGNHTAPYSDPPYKQAKEFEQALKQEWSAIKHFSFNSINGADITIDASIVKYVTVQQIYTNLSLAVKAAAKKTDWDIWEVKL